MKKNEQPQLVKLKGIITAADWDGADNIITYKLFTQNEEEYLIGHKNDKEELLKFTSQYVEISGVIEEDEYGGKIIIPESYKIIKDY